MDIRRTILAIVLSWFLVTGISAQPQSSAMRDVWVSLPDSLLPYLNAQARMELADRYGTDASQPVKGAFEESATIDTLTATYLSATLNAAVRLQLRLLEHTPDTILCMVKTYYGPSPDSEVSFFTTRWQRLETNSFMRSLTDADLLHRPEDLSEERYDELCKMLDPRLVCMTLPADESALICWLSIPMVSREEKVLLEPLLLQTKLKWEGEMFK